MNSKMVFTAAGDALITRKIPDRYEGKQEIIDFLAKGDIRITNLETTITDFDCFPSSFSGGTWLTAKENLLEDLKKYGFDTYSVANNHMLDYSFPGLWETLQKLSAHRMEFTGAGKNLEDAAKPVVWEKKQGISAFLALTSTFDDSARAGVQGPYLPARPGINPLRHQEIYLVSAEQMKWLQEIAESSCVNVKNKRRLKTGYKLSSDQAVFEFKDMKFQESEKMGKKTTAAMVDIHRTTESISKLKKEGAYVAVMIHSHEMKDDSMESIDDFVRESAHAFIDGGADLILGGGCHQMKGIELYQGKPIFYSLGNFIYQNEAVEILPPDFMEKYHLPYTTSASEALAARRSHAKNGGLQAQENYLSFISAVTFIDGQCTSIELLPISLGYDKEGAYKAIPYPAAEEETKTIFQTLTRLSKPFGTNLNLEDGLIKVSLS